MSDPRPTPAQWQLLRKILQWVAAQVNERGLPFGIANDAAELLPELYTVREVSLPRGRNPNPVPRGESKSARHRRIVLEVRERDRGQCCAHGWNGRCLGMLELDHFYGKAKAEESPETLWLLCARHHRLKTDGWPGRLAWLELYRSHCTGYGYADELARLEGMVALELAQHPEHQEVNG
jgi:hypothetical protein